MMRMVRMPLAKASPLGFRREGDGDESLKGVCHAGRAAR
jgi:hypothetical protein